MEQTEKNGMEFEYYTIDVLHLMKTLWHRAWIIVLSALLVAASSFSYATLGITPQYSSSIMLYVNNASVSLGNASFSISSSEITAAQSLVKTYGQILNNRTTLERIIKETGAPFTYKELSKRIDSRPSNNTEIMLVTVTTDSPYLSSEIANCIAEVLPVRISEIIDGASMEVVDSAIPQLEKVSPSILRYTVLGFILGAFLSIAVLTFVALRDDTIHNEEAILQRYSYPVLAKIPELVSDHGKRYGYKRKYYKSSQDYA